MSLFSKKPLTGASRACRRAGELSRQLGALDKAGQGSDMDFPGWRLHPLKGDLADHWSIWVNGNWRGLLLLTYRV
ncbi:MAG: Killer protein [Gammaproteobacteria bacterium]|nr:MAG: Killer protein [Gammaproteobacteria bacterium]